MARRVTDPANFGSSICRRRRSSSLLKIVCAAVTLQTLTIFGPEIFASGAPITMDEVIMAATDLSVRDAASSRFAMSSEGSGAVIVELDMIFLQDVWQAILGDRRTSIRRYRRNALRDVTVRWPSAEIPYQLDLSLEPNEMAAFHASLDDYHTYTCIRFRPAVATDSAYVKVVSHIGCYSYVGRVNASDYQHLSLGKGCREKKTIIHELGHAIGLLHEQSRPDRDDYVYIRTENIRPNMYSNFEKYSIDEVDSRSVPYDYLSVMHYGEKFMSKNRTTLKTIETKDPNYQRRIGKAPGLSFRDVKLINEIYSCSEKLKCRKKVCPGEGFVGTGCRCWCPSGNETIPAIECPGTVLQTSPQQTTPAATTATSRTAAPVATTARSRQCYDANTMCRSWAEQGECAANPLYMLSHCAASCRTCSGGGSVVATMQHPACSNLEVHCDYWQRQGYCLLPTYAMYMQRHCRLACGLCSAAAVVEHRHTTVRATTLRRAMAPAETTRPPAATSTIRRVRPTVAAATAAATRLAAFPDRRGGRRQEEQWVDERVSRSPRRDQRQQ